MEGTDYVSMDADPRQSDEDWAASLAMKANAEIDRVREGESILIFIPLSLDEVPISLNIDHGTNMKVRRGREEPIRRALAPLLTLGVERAPTNHLWRALRTPVHKKSASGSDHHNALVSVSLECRVRCHLETCNGITMTKFM